MRKQIAWTAGTLLTLFLAAAPAAKANDRYQEARYYPSEKTMQVHAGMTMAPGARVYHVVDDPDYNLAGSKGSYFLVSDGTAYQGSPSHRGAVFAATGLAPRTVVHVPAEYRQSWMAVAAGDRPVRCVQAPGTMVSAANMASIPSARPVYTRMTHEEYEEHTAPATAQVAVAHPSRTHPVYHARAYHPRVTNASYTRTTTATHRRAYVHHAYHPAQVAASNASCETVHERTMSTNASFEPTHVSTTEGSISFGRSNLFQIGDSWYMKGDDGWYRSDSWSGPFVHVKRGTVPREVIQSAESSRHGKMFDSDNDEDED
jgi:hypothetical protein